MIALEVCGHVAWAGPNEDWEEDEDEDELEDEED